MHSAPVTAKEWERHREEARRTMPEELQGRELPDVLLPYQQRAVSVIMGEPVTVIEKSRRIGLTWGIAAASVLVSAASRSAGGMDTLYLGYSLDMAREFIDTAAMWAKAFALAACEVEEYIFKDTKPDGSSDDILAYRIVFASGYEIMALTSRPRSLRGRQGMVILDEAAFHDNLDEVMKAALALLMWGGKVVVVSTHDGDTNPFNLLCEEVRKGNKPYALLKITFDDALKDGLYRRICLTQGKEWTPEVESAWREEIVAFYGEDADEELFVIPRHGSGAYIPAALLERAQRAETPVLRFERPDAWAELADYLQEAEARDWCESEVLPVLAGIAPEFDTYAGEDFARKGDLTSLWIAQRRQDMGFACVLLLELRNVPYEVQRTIVFYVLSRLPRLRAGVFDATGNGGYLAEAAAKRFRGVRAQMLNPTFYAEVTPKFKAAFERDEISMPRDVDVYNDHRGIRLVKGVPQIVREEQRAGKGEGGKGGKKRRHGDAAIAHLLCYAASIADNAPPVPRVLSGGVRRSASLLSGYGYV